MVKQWTKTGPLVFCEFCVSHLYEYSGENLSRYSTVVSRMWQVISLDIPHCPVGFPIGRGAYDCHGGFPSFCDAEVGRRAGKLGYNYRCPWVSSKWLKRLPKLACQWLTWRFQMHVRGSVPWSDYCIIIYNYMTGGWNTECTDQSCRCRKQRDCSASETP